MSPQSSAAKTQSANPPRSIRAYCPHQCVATTRGIEYATAGDAAPWRVVECHKCATRFTDPRPPASDWHLYYPDEYGPYQVKHRPRLGKRISLAIEASLARAIANHPILSIAKSWLDPVILVPSGHRRMVDIGCGAASYLARMKAAGWDAVGLEPSAKAAQRAREHYSITIHEGMFPSPLLKAGTFDLVTAHQVLEHLEQPVDALAHMRDLLRPGGRILVTVPNAASWSSRFFGAAWIGWDVPRHLTHFTPDSITKMAESVGLRVLLVQTLAQGGWMRQSAERSTSVGLPKNRKWFRGRNLSDTWSQLLARMGKGDNLLFIAQKDDY